MRSYSWSSLPLTFWKSVAVGRPGPGCCSAWRPPGQGPASELGAGGVHPAGLGRAQAFSSLGGPPCRGGEEGKEKTASPHLTPLLSSLAASMRETAAMETSNSTPRFLFTPKPCLGLPPFWREDQLSSVKRRDRKLPGDQSTGTGKNET